MRPRTRLLVRFDDLEVAGIVPPPVQPQPESEVLIGAGDIAVCGSPSDSATASLIRATPGTVFTAGDNVYPNGTLSEFRTCYDEAWGSFKDRTRPSRQPRLQHQGGTGYYAYFGSAAGDPREGWYAYDLGAWRIYALNSNCGIVRCDAGSPQERWLRADLATNPRTCVAAIWHHPRFSSRGGHDSVAALWQALADANAKFVLSGHDHDYERFAPLDPTGAVDQIRGVRQLIVGTGGVGLNSFGATHPGSEVRNNGTHGIVKLLLHPWGYAWEFLPVAGRTFRDAGRFSATESRPPGRCRVRSERASGPSSAPQGAIEVTRKSSKETTTGAFPVAPEMYERRPTPPATWSAAVELVAV